ncbi:unnamed protein product [Zymoseptoria tritici ST99CH_1A5]|uniref:Extracellular membrane protein CFEM domain-containing protein n=3 Tax=Zymoseptoria tritici TaxID=1047171 RepID=A0A1X7RKQ4_ZYMT9|nr:unnamed protein product [Zymoseptoria tritici ST99CH_3D7]SMR46315.1 unnamed protein product [Zymoseptoria tritici ST99CH_1E4]SMY21467.1 unnamed protein product [Zymoseptoria tritici ST99CH_1A5]
MKFTIAAFIGLIALMAPSAVLADMCNCPTPGKTDDCTECCQFIRGRPSAKSCDAIAGVNYGECTCN